MMIDRDTRGGRADLGRLLSGFDGGGAALPRLDWPGEKAAPAGPCLGRPCGRVDGAAALTPLLAPNRPRPPRPDELLALAAAYAELLAAAWRASDDPLPRARAVALGVLEGVPRALLLWLLYQGHAEHLAGTGAGVGPSASLILRGGSCLALTPEGESFAALFLARLLRARNERDLHEACSAVPLGELAPSYRNDSRQFLWGRHLLKSFRQGAANQELILRAAQEMGWPDWFDDPLPRRGGCDPKVRLHDTIKDLNRRQLLPLVRFKGDGTGTRVGWELR